MPDLTSIARVPQASREVRPHSPAATVRHISSRSIGRGLPLYAQLQMQVDVRERVARIATAAGGA